MHTFASVDSDEQSKVLECHLGQGVTQNSKGFGPVHVLVVTSASQDCHDIISCLYTVISHTAFYVTGDWVQSAHEQISNQGLFESPVPAEQLPLR